MATRGKKKCPSCRRPIENNIPKMQRGTCSKLSMDSELEGHVVFGEEAVSSTLRLVDTSRELVFLSFDSLYRAR